jgi:hypothetical protein
MKLTSFYNYKSYRWFWINALVLAGLTGYYLYDRPLQGASGNTPLGYTYGVIATAGILYLMWFGVRKRSYSSNAGTLKGCLSAHIWLGIALLLIVPLHSGFSFGMNIHTLAYVLMVIVILSGIWGAVNYTVLADQIKWHRGGATTPKLLSQLHLLSADIGNLAKSKSDAFQVLLRKCDFSFSPSIWSALFGGRPEQLRTEDSAALLAGLPSEEQADGVKLISLINKKRTLASDVLHDVAIVTKLRLWLYVHVPVSIALLFAVAIHIFVVFYYR